MEQYEILFAIENEIYVLRLTSSLFLHSSFFFGPLEMIGSMHVCSLLAKIHILLKDESLRKISDTQLAIHFS